MLLFLTIQIQGMSRCPLSLVWTADEPGSHFAVNLMRRGWGRASSAGFSGGLRGPLGASAPHLRRAADGAFIWGQYAKISMWFVYTIKRHGGSCL